MGIRTKVDENQGGVLGGVERFGVEEGREWGIRRASRISSKCSDSRGPSAPRVQLKHLPVFLSVSHMHTPTTTIACCSGSSVCPHSPHHLHPPSLLHLCCFCHFHPLSLFLIQRLTMMNLPQLQRTWQKSVLSKVLKGKWECGWY